MAGNQRSECHPKVVPDKPKVEGNKGESESETEGFDIETLPPIFSFGGSWPVVLDLSREGIDVVSEAYYKFGCELSVRYVIAEHNREKIDRDTRQSKIYQTRVYFDLLGGEFDIEIFRERKTSEYQGEDDLKMVSGNPKVEDNKGESKTEQGKSESMKHNQEMINRKSIKAD
ncbi:hypothetical protein JCGZ_26768 [Jatropha curcas]|uniref:Uncharacterized protein n=1 Tax=Jatropha curcas TaxID=180498 RepID=A0A067LB94_JATCU|nr:hypothetical protein JCGZ_26768 [Jatropha curcas]